MTEKMLQVFYKLAIRHIELLKQQGELEKENEQLKQKYQRLMEKLERERCSHQKQHMKWENEIKRPRLKLNE